MKIIMSRKIANMHSCLTEGQVYELFMKQGDLCIKKDDDGDARPALDVEYLLSEGCKLVKVSSRIMENE